jgi:hypothetical protein
VEDAAQCKSACGLCKRERQFQVPGLGPQVSGTGYQVQVRVRGNIQILNLYPYLNT